MAQEISANARLYKDQIAIQPNPVFTIDGVSTLFGAAEIVEAIIIGMDDLYIDGTWVIGGNRSVSNQKEYFLFGAGAKSSSRITWKIRPDKGVSSGVGNLKVTLVDKNNEVSRLVTPGKVVADVLGRECKLEFGFKETSYPEDYITFFRGIIETYDIGPSSVSFFITAIDDKLRQPLYPVRSTSLNIAISDTATAIPVVSTDQLPEYYSGHPTGQDSALDFYIRIDDEIIRYSSLSPTEFIGCTRGELDTIAAPHDDESQATSVVSLRGPGLELALKLLLGGRKGYYETGIEATHINYITIDTTEELSNAIFLQGVDLVRDYGVSSGDYITTIGSGIAANNVTDKIIDQVFDTDEGSYLIVSGVSFVNESGTSLTFSLRSQYDTLGFGLAMHPKNVDVKEFKTLNNTFLSAFILDYRLEEISEVKQFIEQEIFLPMGCYAITRSGRYSVGYHIGPYPDVEVVAINKNNVLNAENLELSRSISQNFINTVYYRYDYDLIEQRYKATGDHEDTDAKSQVQVGDKVLFIKSKGLRSSDSGDSLSRQAAIKLLETYGVGAEFINGVEINMSAGFVPDVGDIVLLDSTDLNITNLTTGDKTAFQKYMRIYSKTIDLAKGQVKVDLVNTAFRVRDRYGFISPSSQCDVGSSTSIIKLKKGLGTPEYKQEGYKWTRYEGEQIRVHNIDNSTSELTTIQEVIYDNPSLLIVSPALSFTPNTDHYIDIPAYQYASETFKLRYYYVNTTETITSGASQTVFDVSDSGPLFVGSPVIVRNSDWTLISSEVNVIDISGNTITVDDDLGFVPSSGQVVELIGFVSDEGQPYRII